MKIEMQINATNIGEKNIKENLKNCFSNQALCIYYNNNSYYFEYDDFIKDIYVKIKTRIYLTSDNNGLEKIQIETNDDNISEYDLEFYYYKNVFQKLTEDLLCENLDTYTVRVYYKIIHDIGFKGEYIINWKNKIRFKPLLNEKEKGVESERIISFDCEVHAKSLNQARSKALNITKEFVAYLSLLIDTGFYEVQSKYSHYIKSCRQDDREYLIGEFQRNAFIDPELNLIVMNNMNGLRHKDDYKYNQPLSFVSFNFLDQNFEIQSSIIENNSEVLNKHLKDTFLNLKISKSNIENEYSEGIDCDPIYNLKLLIPRQIRKYYQGILKLSGNKAIYFNNSCRLYNISQTCGAYEPTLMLSYMVSAVDCLAKSENKNFTEFMKLYLKDDYDKNICDFLYGNLRSGHFHSGEMFFTEYNMNLDITLDNSYQKMSDMLLRGKYNLRKALISWVNQNILL